MITKTKKTRKGEDFKSVAVSVLTGSFVVLLLVFFVVSNWRMGEKRSDLQQQIADLEKQIELLEETNEAFREGLLETEDATYWEGRLREQGYKKPGEQAVVVIPPEEEESSVSEDIGFWDKVRETLGF